MKKARLLCELTSSENFLFGGDEEDRTPDLRIANASLSQLSYTPENRDNMPLTFSVVNKNFKNFRFIFDPALKWRNR